MANGNIGQFAHDVIAAADVVFALWQDSPDDVAYLIVKGELTARRRRHRHRQLRCDSYEQAVAARRVFGKDLLDS